MKQYKFIKLLESIDVQINNDENLEVIAAALNLIMSATSTHTSSSFLNSSLIKKIFKKLGLDKESDKNYTEMKKFLTNFYQTIYQKSSPELKDLLKKGR